MMNKIGFGNEVSTENVKTTVAGERCINPRKSVVTVYFSERNMKLAYYNDMFDLRVGDIVFVEGKLEGMQGRVIDVNYNFRIKISDYKKVIALADTDVKGRFFMADSHFISFESSVIPYKKVLSWYKPPADEEEFVSGSDETTILLSELDNWKLNQQIAQRGEEYYYRNRVIYLSVDGTKGRAIVEGEKVYELSFDYNNGEISGLNCDCFCSYACKHQVAAMLQLRDILEVIEKDYTDIYMKNNYFSAISKRELFAYGMNSCSNTSFIIE